MDPGYQVSRLGLHQEMGRSVSFALFISLPRDTEFSALGHLQNWTG